jgi:hypothetical protein
MSLKFPIMTPLIHSQTVYRNYIERRVFRYGIDEVVVVGSDFLDPTSTFQPVKSSNILHTCTRTLYYAFQNIIRLHNLHLPGIRKMTTASRAMDITLQTPFHSYSVLREGSLTAVPRADLRRERGGHAKRMDVKTKRNMSTMTSKFSSNRF